jgi:hypothetical protein
MFKNAEEFDYPLEDLRQYPNGKPKVMKKGGSIDALCKLDSFDGKPKLGDPNDVKGMRWKDIAEKAEARHGTKFLKGMKFFGSLASVWLVVNLVVDPVETLAQELNITPEGAQALLDGQVTFGVNHPWRHGDSERSAVLQDGTEVVIGMPYYFARVNAAGFITEVWHGEIVKIEMSEHPYIYDFTVKQGQQETTHSGNGLRANGQAPTVGSHQQSWK